MRCVRAKGEGEFVPEATKLEDTGSRKMDTVYYKFLPQRSSLFMLAHQNKRPHSLFSDVVTDSSSIGKRCMSSCDL